MTLRRALITTAIAGGSLLIASGPAFAQTYGDDDTIPETGANNTAQNSLMVAGGAAVLAGSALVLVRRKSSAKA